MGKQIKIELSENQLRILELFTCGFDKEYYVREVSNLLKISPRTAQLNLETLEKLAILESMTKGKIKNYKLRTNYLAKEYLKLTETFKNIRFLEKNELIREIISKINVYINGIGLVFGSYAKDTQKEDSDLDIFIAGSYDRKEIDKIGNLYNLKISVKNYTKALFKKEMTKDYLIKEILNNHIIFQGSEDFVNILWQVKN